MPNISGLLQIGSSALLAQQKAIDITGNNIANVNTAGYSRQRLNIVQNLPIRDQSTTSSTGVYAHRKIQRFYDQFVTAQLNGENENLGRWEAQKTALEKIEVLFDEVSGYGLSEAMSEFWNAWQDLSNNPSGHVERTSLLSAGQFLATTFNQLSSNISSAQKDIDTNVVENVTDINRMAGQIAELNRKIAQVEVNGHNANDYRDERDLLVYNLSKLIDIDSFEDGDGNMTITVGGGKPLVESTFTWNLSTAESAGVQNIYWEDSSGAAHDITGRIEGGELKGWLEARDEIINGYKTRLDTLANSIITEVNALHNDAGPPASGFNLYGSQNNFFVGGNASDIAVHSAIAADVSYIAAAGSAAALPGDNSAAMAIADLQNRLTMSGSSSTFDDYYIALVGDIGNDVRTADLNNDHQNNMIRYLQNYREEVSGVSLDEEMVNLIKFQHAYSAAARLITTVDEMMQTVIGMVR
ncbi:MAG: flagellar hook-associated protein FlgK [Desulfobacteraceae bacterium]|nr:MAG: flagellar hook-associated protein FlgK [Desulfobacteraceae bacterium]